MFDIGWSELLVIAVVLIVVVGPKDLPPMLRAFGKMTANLRKMAGEFRTQFDEALRESELDDVRKTISDAKSLNPTNALRDAINPLRQMGQDIRDDLQKATQMPSSDMTKTDIEAQHAVEGTPPITPLHEVPANFPLSSATPAAASAPVTPVTTSPVAPATTPAAAPAQQAASASPAQSAPAAAQPVQAEKPKAARKSSSKAKPAAESVEAPVAVIAEKPKRSRAAAKPAPAPVVEPVRAEPVEQAAAKAPARKRAPKKTDTPKDDA